MLFMAKRSTGLFLIAFLFTAIWSFTIFRSPTDRDLLSIPSNNGGEISPWSRIHYGLVRSTDRIAGDVDNDIVQKVKTLKSSIEQILSSPSKDQKPRLRDHEDWGGLNPPIHHENLPWHHPSPLCAVPLVADIESAIHTAQTSDCSGGGAGINGATEWHRPLMPSLDAAGRRRAAARRRRLEKAALRRLAAHVIASDEQKMGRYLHGGVGNVAKASRPHKNATRMRGTVILDIFGPGAPFVL